MKLYIVELSGGDHDAWWNSIGGVYTTREQAEEAILNYEIECEKNRKRYNELESIICSNFRAHRKTSQR